MCSTPYRRGEGDERNRRDWLLTTVWALSMDTVAVGMVLMALSGIYMWLGTAGKRNPGLAGLGAGQWCAVSSFSA